MTRSTQRFANFEKALASLGRGVSLRENRELTELEKQGVIQAFEYTFELAWKTIKDVLNEQNVDVKFPRESIKKAFEYGLVTEGELWLDMLEKRNLMAHSYDEERAKIALTLISDNYYEQLIELQENLHNR